MLCRRIVGEIILEAASALKMVVDAVSPPRSMQAQRGEDTASTLGGGMMMRSSAPPEHTNDLWLCLENQTNGTMLLKAFAPTSVSNVEVYACNDLVSNVWTLVETNLHPIGPTNPEYIA